MTADSLNALDAYTPLYLPTEWEVITWIFQGRVGTTNYYTLTHPPDPDGVVSNKRPVYLHALDLANATLEEKEAWRSVVSGLEERKQWINKTKLIKRS